MSLPVSEFFSGKGIPKELLLELSEDEDVFDSIKQGMLENNLNKVLVKKIEGHIKKAFINYMLGSRFKSREIQKIKVEDASGHYELMGKDFFGNLHVIINEEGKRNTVTLTKGKASEGLKITLSFVQILSK